MGQFCEFMLRTAKYPTRSPPIIQRQISPTKQKAMLDFAIKTATNAAQICEPDLQLLRNNGFDDEDIWDIGAITALFALSNRMASLAAMRPNDEFYTMGRDF